jgi:hypothetical protein
MFGLTVTMTSGACSTGSDVIRHLWDDKRLPVLDDTMCTKRPTDKRALAPHHATSRIPATFR